MRLAISFLLSKNFQLFVKKKCSLLYPDRGIVPRSGYIPRLVPFSSLFTRWAASIERGSRDIRRIEASACVCHIPLDIGILSKGQPFILPEEEEIKIFDVGRFNDVNRCPFAKITVTKYSRLTCRTYGNMCFIHTCKIHCQVDSNPQ